MRNSAMMRRLRIIPAYAGQITSWSSTSSNSSGSSPHTRDKLIQEIFFRISARIIPAYAGQMKPSGMYADKSRDHPRIRGTNPAGLECPSGGLGSSPHTRDKCYIFKHINPLSGIIPAYAGQIRAFSAGGTSV